MARLLVMIIVGYVLYLMFKGRPGAKEFPKDAMPDDETFKDPVCGVYVTKDDAVIGTMDGEKFHFCSMACLEKFREQLEK
ncbi:YHS domain-containing protein [Geotalea uraniireducens]|uniref:YHS domain-containing protein n=1 Tax=Geotalea uraniireducens (strain Rf4) TaxID=351605 RepID=A5GBY7_GEOUR|nr:YHS domain-containing protein [Geotalea uraniireducens]ABQ24914.1 hypothetical protein Gura_0704 [Geotalea uraniireducens Rf4]